ncbi:MAG: phosphate ABC transporter permease PstA [Phycisphaerales bacterium]
MSASGTPSTSAFTGPDRDRVAALVNSRKRWDKIFMVAGALLSALCLAVLAALMIKLISDGWGRLTPDFFFGDQSNNAEKAGIKVALIGTMLVMIVTAVTAIPLGIGAGIYLEEYARKNWITTIIEINIANLAGVPSIIWGLMSLGLLVYGLKTGQSILTAGLTLGLLVLPIIIVATREAIRSIPQGIREASFACGATRLQTVRYHILPYSLSGVLTGCIIAMSRAIGETAPLVTIGALAYITSLPPVPFSERPWPLEVVSKTAFVADTVDKPISNVKAGTLELTIEVPKDQPDKYTRETRSVAIPAGVTPNTLVQALEDAPDITARIDDEGLIHIENEQFGGIALGADSSNVAAAAQFPHASNRYGATDWLSSSFTVLPIQVYDWVSRPQKEFQVNAAAAGVVLVAVTLLMNGMAIFLRARLRKRLQW